MIEGILGFFGYCKIPKEAAQAAVTLEYLIEKLYKYEKKPPEKSFYRNMLETQQMITRFLRAGRLLRRDVF